MGKVKEKYIKNLYKRTQSQNRKITKLELKKRKRRIKTVKDLCRKTLQYLSEGITEFKLSSITYFGRQRIFDSFTKMTYIAWLEELAAEEDMKISLVEFDVETITEQNHFYTYCYDNSVSVKLEIQLEKEESLIKKHMTPKQLEEYELSKIKEESKNDK